MFRGFYLFYSLIVYTINSITLNWTRTTETTPDIEKRAIKCNIPALFFSRLKKRTLFISTASDTILSSLLLPWYFFYRCWLSSDGPQWGGVCRITFVFFDGVSKVSLLMLYSFWLTSANDCILFWITSAFIFDFRIKNFKCIYFLIYICISTLSIVGHTAALFTKNQHFYPIFTIIHIPRESQQEICEYLSISAKIYKIPAKASHHCS